jgi:hypothetical protein
MKSPVSSPVRTTFPAVAENRTDDRLRSGVSAALLAAQRIERGQPTARDSSLLTGYSRRRLGLITSVFLDVLTMNLRSLSEFTLRRYERNTRVLAFLILSTRTLDSKRQCDLRIPMMLSSVWSGLSRRPLWA